MSEDTDNGEDNDADGEDVEDDVKELMACGVLPVAMFSI